MTKKEARILARNYRYNIDSVTHKIKSNIIIQKLTNDPRFINAKIIGIYYPFNNEVDLSNLKHPNAKFAYPKIVNNTLEFVLVNKKTKWKSNIYGIKEPINGKIVKTIDLLLIPCLAKNKNNYRLGYGKGYYDKYLSQNKPLHKVGILFDNLEYNFNEEIFDIPLDDFISN